SGAAVREATRGAAADGLEQYRMTTDPRAAIPPHSEVRFDHRTLHGDDHVREKARMSFKNLDLLRTPHSWRPRREKSLPPLTGLLATSVQLGG
ncbi:MAG: hypothetical protein KIT22_05010, partial [Verrucomicrobiae bacterium]|nr:hypothetical protein [Verrucomicrobiae bacterium]